MGLPFDAVDMAGAVDKVAAAARQGQRCFFSTPNLNFLIGSHADAAFRNSVIHSDLSVADGMPVVWMARALGIPVRSRVAGSGMFEALRARGESLPVYFFGGPPGVAEAAAQRLNATPSGLHCTGFYSPGFGSVEQMSSPEVIGAINASRAQLLVVALGAKKGQQWIEHNLAALRVPAISHLGAVVNFVAGTVSRAPEGVGRSGLEWVWRIKEEPALWRRYWSDGLAFLQLLLAGVLPAALARLVPASRTELAAAAIQHEPTATGQVLRLRGAWTDANAAPLRSAFDAAARAQRDLALELQGVSRVDSATLALLMLLYGHQQRLGLAWRVSGVSAALQRQFARHRAAFLLAPAASALACAEGVVASDHQRTVC